MAKNKESGNSNVPGNDLYGNLNDPKVREFDYARFKIVPQHVLSQFAPHVRDRLAEVFAHEEAINKALKDKKNMAVFSKNPVDFLKKMKINLPPLLQKQFQSYNLDKEIESTHFVLPNGKSIKPKIKLNIKTK